MRSLKWSRSIASWCGVFAILALSDLSAQTPSFTSAQAISNAGPAPAGTAPYTFGTLAGMSLVGSADGVGTAARFLYPEGVAVDSGGTVYAADTGNHTIRRITADRRVTTLAGLAGQSGSTDAVGAAARFKSPRGLAVDGAGVLYVADSGDHTIRMVTPTGVVSTIAGLAGSAGSADAAGSAARFNAPTSIAVDVGGTVYVGDSSNYTVRQITPAGVVSTLAGSAGQPGCLDGVGRTARFSSLIGIAVDSAGVLYVADGYCGVRMISPAGTVTTPWPVSRPTRTAGGQERIPTNYVGVAVDSTDAVYVSEAKFGMILKSTPVGQLSQFASVSGSGQIAVDHAGTVYLPMVGDSRILQITAGGDVSTVAGSNGSCGHTDGAGSSAARFCDPSDIAVDNSGMIYVADTQNFTIRRVTSAGVVTTLAGLAGSGGSADGAGNAARFGYPIGVAVDTTGTVYVADFSSSTIRRITPSGLVTTLAGLAGSAGNADGVGSAARFNWPQGIAVDGTGTIYVADTGNSTIRRITPAGVVSTLAAGFNFPKGVAVDDNGTVYVADTFSNTIRTIAPGGVVSTLAGLAGSSGSVDGVGSAARFNGPRGIAVDGGGTVYVADQPGHTIRTITAGGVVSTLAGSAGVRGSADGTGSAARFYWPGDVAVDAGGTLYVADSFNNTIRQGVLGTPASPAVSAQPADRTVVAGQNASFTVAASGNPIPGFQWQVSTNAGTSWTDLTDSASYSGTTTTALVVTGAIAGMSGSQFRCVAGNSVATVASSAATLTVYVLTASPASVRLGATKAGAAGTLVSTTTAQTVTVGFNGPTTSWAAVADQPWVQVSNTSETGPGPFTVEVINPNNVIGANTLLNATITVTAVNLGLSTTVPVVLSVQQTGSSAAPFGVFDTPMDGATGLSGSIAVTGWALDDIGIGRVEIWRDPVPGETTSLYPGPGSGTGKIVIAVAFFINGSRPDVEAAYPSYPLAHRGGWGYLLLTHGLWNQGNGTYTLYAFAFDEEGHSTTLGTKTISVDNAHATKPFGALDSPTYGRTVSRSFWNYGWALTPGSSCTITNGNVWMAVDSGPLIPVDYGDLRTDVAAAFPGFTNAAGAGGALYLDTETLTNGTHQIGWLVTDSCGRQDGIGSRFFTVLNGAVPGPYRPDRLRPGFSGQPALQATADGGHDGRVATGSAVAWANVASGVADSRRTVNDLIAVRHTGGDWQWSGPSATGGHVVAVQESDRIEVQLPTGNTDVYAGYHMVNGERRALPLGSSLDAQAGIFYWQPAAGFLGRYDLEFTLGAGNRTAADAVVRVSVVVGPSMRTMIDTPEADAVRVGPFTLAGWTLDLAATQGTGIDTVHVWAYPTVGGDPVFLGVATIGDARPDVAAIYGAQFERAAYSLTVDQLPPGTYDLVVYPHRAATAAFEGAQLVRVTVR